MTCVQCEILGDRLEALEVELGEVPRRGRELVQEAEADAIHAERLLADLKAKVEALLDADDEMMRVLQADAKVAMVKADVDRSTVAPEALAKCEAAKAAREALRKAVGR